MRFKKPEKERIFMDKVKPNYCKKITVSGIGLDTDTLETTAGENKKGNIPVMRVYGRIDDAKTGQSQFNEYVRFSGEFESVNLIDGSVWRSRSLIVPEIAEQNLQDMYNQAGEGASIDFAVDVTVSYYESNKGGRKFRYGVTTVLDNSGGEDNLSKIRKQLPEPKTQKSKK